MARYLTPLISYDDYCQNIHSTNTCILALIYHASGNYRIKHKSNTGMDYEYVYFIQLLMQTDDQKNEIEKAKRNEMMRSEKGK